MPRFVILTHDYPGWHWDFMLERDEDLRTWRLLSVPASSHPISAEALAGHRKAYLDYEGPVSGNRGAVQRWDQGDYELLEDSADRVVVRLRGTRLKGVACLIRAPAFNERYGESPEWIFQLASEAEGGPGN